MNTSTETSFISQRLKLCLPRLAEAWRDDHRVADLGLDSMDAVELLCVVHEEFGVRLTESEFFPEQTIGEFFAAIAGKIQT